jgi:hypothetical protein
MSTNDDLHFHPWSELENRPRRKLLVPVMCFETGITTIVAPWGEVKTTTGHSLARTVGTGGVWDGQIIAKRPYIWIAGEDLDGVRAMDEAWKRAHPEASLPEGWFLDGEVDLSTDDKVTEVLRKLEDLPMSPLIVFDALSDMIGDLKEDSSQDMIRVYKGGFRRISEEREASLLVLHHSGWNTTRERGSSAIRAKSDIVAQITKFDPANDFSEYKQHKRRDGVRIKFGYKTKLVPVVGYPQPIPIVTGVRIGTQELRDAEKDRILNEPLKRPSEAEVCAKKIVELLLDREKFPDGATSGELEHASGASHGTFHKALKLMKGNNWLVGGGERDTLYNLAADGSWKGAVASQGKVPRYTVQTVQTPIGGFVPSTDVPMQSQYSVPSLDRSCTVNQSEVVETPMQPAEPPKADPTVSKANELLNRRSGGPDLGKKVEKVEKVVGS